MKIAGRNSAVFMSRIPGSVVQNLAARYRKKQAALVQNENAEQMHFYEESIVSTGASVELTRQEEDHWQVRLWQGQ